MPRTIAYIQRQFNQRYFRHLTGHCTTYETAIPALNQHFDPIQNKDMVFFEFRDLKREVNETLNDFYHHLKTKASDCNFPSINDEMWTQIIYKTRDKCLCRQALRESFTLQELLNHGRSLECIDEQAKRLEGHHSQMPTLALNAVDTQLNQSRFLLNNSGFRAMDYITIAETKMAYITNDKRENRLCHPSN